MTLQGEHFSKQSQEKGVKFQTAKHLYYSYLEHEYTVEKNLNASMINFDLNQLNPNSIS